MSATTMAPGGPGLSLLVVAVALTQGSFTKGALARGALVPGDQPPEAVPVIHLHHGKASVDEYLRMIPDTLLASNKRVKPIDVRKIEHEDFIDYEIEFVELPNDEAVAEEFIIKKTDVSDSSRNVNTEDNKIPDDPPSDATSGREGSSSSSRRAGDSKEVNLVNFSDLFRRARTKSRSRVASAASSDIRRRRRIKLKRDPSGGRGLGGSRDRGDASSEARNHIDTAQPPIKREHGSSLSHTIFSKSRTRSKSRNLIRDIPETDRKGTILDRRTTRPLQRHASFRARKRQRVPLKFGRSFGHEDRPADQLIRLRSPDIIAKLERSANNERNVMKSRDKSDDDLYDGMSMQQQEDTAHVRLELTTQTLATFPILTTPPPDTAAVNNNNNSKPAPNISTTSDAVKTAAENNDLVDLEPAVNRDEESELTRRVHMSSPPPAPSITTTTTATATTTKSGAEAEANERGGERVSLQRTTPQPGQSTTPATTTAATTTAAAAGLMMYPEVFSVAAPVTSVPVSLLSVFGPHQPRSSRLQVGPSSSNSNNNNNNSPQVSWSSSRSAVVSRHRPAPALSSHAPALVSVFSPPTSTSTSTISSGLQFSIISTSTSAPELETSTLATSEAATITSATATTAASHSSRQQQVSSTTTRPSSSSAAADRDYDKSSLQNEFKFGLVTTTGSITSDNPMMTTSIPEDLQLSESITSVYLHNSSTAPAVSNNIKTTETQPKKDPDSSITLLPFSKLTNQARDSSKESSPPPSSPAQKVGTPIQKLPTPVQPVQKVVPTVQKVAKPVQKVARPIERELAPEKKVATPSQKIASSEQPVQKMVQPVQKVVQPVQKVVPPAEKVETNIQKVATPVQPVQRVMASLQKAARPLQKVVQQVQKVAPPVQRAPRPVQEAASPVQEAVHVVTPATVMTYPEVTGSSTGGEYLEAHEGRYLEVNPGQYHEVNPGQYHEISPGQYHEVNPGQYDEVNPGQYQAAHEGQYQDLEPAYPRPGDYEVNEVKVDFDNRDEHKIYNVQAKAGDFIIGEVGKIDVNNGQTVEGVRYTALEGEVDPLRIAEILNRYFGTRTS